MNTPKTDKTAADARHSSPTPGSVPGREYLVVYGPPCSGKTLNAQAIMEALNCDHAFDFFERGQIEEAQGRVILFSPDERVRHPDHSTRPYRYVSEKISIATVKAMLGSRWIEPQNVEAWRGADGPREKGE